MGVAVAVHVGMGDTVGVGVLVTVFVAVHVGACVGRCFGVPVIVLTPARPIVGVGSSVSVWVVAVAVIVLSSFDCVGEIDGSLPDKLAVPVSADMTRVVDSVAGSVFVGTIVS
jgi:hypothetical protein